MANTRIKDISTAATTLNSDDFIAVDGSTAGTRKMAKADLITEVSTGVSGTYLEESNNLSDVASKDTSKLNLEVPDVGTAPNEVPLNGQLGSMAYQSAEAVSMGTVSADELDIAPASGDARIDLISGDNTSSSRVVFGDSDDTNVGEVRYSHSNNSLAFHTGNTGEKVRIDSAGRVGIGTSSPSSYSSSGYDLVVGTNSGNHGATIVAGSTATGSLFFADGTGATERQQGAVSYNHTSNSLAFKTDNTTRWTIDSTGNLVANSTGIDFGSAATSAGDGTGTTGTPADSVLADYEVGSWTPSYSSSGATFSYTTQSGRYVKVGKQVTAQFYLLATASGTTSNAINITGLPFLCFNSTFAQFTAAVWFTGTNPTAFITNANTANLLGWQQNSGSALRRNASDVSGQYLVGQITYEATT